MEKELTQSYRLRTKINIKNRYSVKYGFVLPYTDIISNIIIIKFYNRFLNYLNQFEDYRNYNYVIVRINEKNELVAKFFLFENNKLSIKLINYLRESKSYNLKGIVSQFEHKETIDFGVPYVWAYIKDTIIRSNVNSFCQVNPFTRHQVYDTVVKYAKETGCENLYCIGGEMIYYMLNLDMLSYYGCSNCKYIIEDAKATDFKGKELEIELNSYKDHKTFRPTKDNTVVILNVFKITKEIIEFINLYRDFIKYIIIISCKKKEVMKMTEFELVKDKYLHLMPYTKAVEFVQLRKVIKIT